MSYGEGVCFIPVIVGATKARLFDSLAKLIKSNNTLSHTSMCKSTTFKKQKKKVPFYMLVLQKNVMNVLA